MTSRHPLPHRRAADTVVKWIGARAFNVNGTLVIVALKAIPKGWEVSGFREAVTHNRWSLLIEKTKP
jgi:hypothetical protein